MQQKVTDIMMKASPNGEEAQNKDEQQKDKLNKPKMVEAVTNEVTIGGPKPYVKGEKNNINTLVICDILKCGYIVCIKLTKGLLLYVTNDHPSETTKVSFSLKDVCYVQMSLNTVPFVVLC